MLAWYFERMRGIVESHDRSVEKFIGDQIVPLAARLRERLATLQPA